MALIKDQKRRYDIPHEPGEWIELRPMRNGDMLGVDLDGDPFTGSIALLEKLVVAWSYEDPPSPETVRMLDMQTTKWLAEVLQQEQGIDEESVAEKNGSTSSS